ncbi:Adhesive plaque matrix protein 2 [Holothuria leucospilota]|uniref:Adhesive plaque matrix protein 2 n=1 Tax=Holothuria leucospilota TaxID=206669 RepID=A0A9Q1BWU0_HOLLE|nr:Adhesive plaque matrix protein 2 [Holothuria leucospilota]
MDLHFIVAFVLAITIFNSAQGQFTNGANVAECDSLVPAGVTPSSGETPFLVASTAQTYTPGGPPITVFVASNTTRVVTARGLVVQARRSASVADNTPVGTFGLPSNGLYRLLTCGSSTGGTITNIDSTDKPLVQIFTWNPPAENYGTVRFVVSLAETNDQFWAQVTSANLSSSAGPLGPLSTEVCPIPVLTLNVGTWTPPNCVRDSTDVSQTSCSPPSGSTFPPGLTTITCICSDRGETASCQINLIIDSDPCSPNPCENGGTCFVVPSVQSGFVCNCPPGFPQPTCGLQNACNPNPCQNGGTCLPTQSGFVCECLAGFIQPTCSVDDPCFPNPCANGGTCFGLPSAPSGFVCNCLPGFNQPTCGANACNPNPCQNGGICSLTQSGFACQCPPGFPQPTCSDGNPCAGNPCLGNECRVSSISIAGYTCHSTTGSPCN